MAFKAIYPVISKIVSSTKVLGNYHNLGYSLTYEKAKDVLIKINRFDRICGTLPRKLRKGAAYEALQLCLHYCVVRSVE